MLTCLTFYVVHMNIFLWESLIKFFEFLVQWLYEMIVSLATQSYNINDVIFDN